MLKKVLFVLFISASFISGKASETKPILQQLKGLNKYWSIQENTTHLSQLNTSLNEIDLIQTHLLLVVEKLRNKSTNHLTPTQETNRSFLLNELRAYAKQRVFPINEFHTTRTPYFIDEVGTACAVGQLIIKSGNRGLAEFISQKNNYDFIEDMPHQTELLSWANQHGFELEELKWIQPTYGPQCPSGQVIQPICRDGVGCFNPDWQADGLVSPISYYSEYNNGSGWVLDSNNIWLFWGARIGQHKITITDSTNASIVYQYTINNIPPIPINASIIDQSSGAYCNGQVSLSVNNSSGTTYSYSLTNTQTNFYEQSPSSVFDSLCTGTYEARVSTTFNCYNTITVVVNNSTGLSQNNFSQYVKVQSPLQQYLNVDISLTGRKQLKIYSMLGALVFQRSFTNQSSMDLSKLEDGLYILQIEFNGNVYNRKIVKAN
ncbi:MAG: T9SS type A sorting domain-containing protein [Flavobacteriales bacterium]|nr:T9SS type A sorting domain-containing protein [Flavobacteriales bacterium]